MGEKEKEKEKGRGKGKARTARLDAVAGGRRGSTRRIGKAGCDSLLSLTLSVEGDGEKQRKGKEEHTRATRWRGGAMAFVAGDRRDRTDRQSRRGGENEASGASDGGTS